MAKLGTVLVVDDEPLVRNSLARMLGRDHLVTTVEDGVAALGLIASGMRFDLIVSDLNMPALDGADLMDAIAKIDPSQADRMVFVSANADAPIATRVCLHLVIAKPFSLVELQSLVKRAVVAARNGYFPRRHQSERRLKF